MANTDLIITERSKLVAIADAVRANSDITDEMSLDEIVSGINYVAANASGGIDTSDATATENDILSGKTAYVDGEKVTGNMGTYDGFYECSGESTGGSGEDVSAETAAYTNRLVNLEAAIIALEAELEGKASGGSGNVSYFTVINNSPYDLIVNGCACISANSTLIPYIDNGDSAILTIVTFNQVPDSSIVTRWIELIEDENGEFVEEDTSGVIFWAGYNASFNMMAGATFCSIPWVLDHTITFEYIEV